MNKFKEEKKMSGTGNKDFNKTINRGQFEFKMTKEMAKSYLKMRKGDDKKKTPQEYLCQVVNNEFGIKGTCTRVLWF
jgi:hypothetical protein